jgi:small conductance mechanosensitive channel
MEQLGFWSNGWREVWPVLAVLAASALALAITHGLFALSARQQGTRVGFLRHVFMLLVTALGLVAVVLALPMSDTLRGQLLGLLGLALTGVVALSSTTFVANAMAGLMLRAVGNFRPGDFVRVNGEFGRVTERGLFHTELQTEDRDLATLPNLYLVTNPVKVVRGSGTLISATLSLGYDVPHAQIEALLGKAATAAELEEPFVRVLELGDFSVKYRVAGFLADVKRLVSARSRLHTQILDSLHGAGVEIVSPNFVNQRRLAEGFRVVPAQEEDAVPVVPSTAAEELMFDKADASASLEDLRLEQVELLAEIAELEKTAGGAEEGDEQRLEAEIAERRARCEELAAALRDAEETPAK